MAGKTVTSVTLTSSPASNTQGVTGCAIASGEVYCWGHNGQGQVDGGSGNRLTPVLVGGALAGKTATAVYTTSSSNSGGSPAVSCAIADGDLYCWGYAYYGDTGTNNLNSGRIAPTLVGGAMAGKTVGQ